MSNSRIEKLRQQVREMGHNLAIIEKRGLRGKDHVAKRIAHNLLLDQLYELEKRVWVMLWGSSGRIPLSPNDLQNNPSPRSGTHW